MGRRDQTSARPSAMAISLQAMIFVVLLPCHVCQQQPTTLRIVVDGESQSARSAPPSTAPRPSNTGLSLSAQPPGVQTLRRPVPARVYMTQPQYYSAQLDNEPPNDRTGSQSGNSVNQRMAGDSSQTVVSISVSTPTDETDGRASDPARSGPTPSANRQGTSNSGHVPFFSQMVDAFLRPWSVLPQARTPSPNPVRVRNSRDEEDNDGSQASVVNILVSSNQDTSGSGGGIAGRQTDRRLPVGLTYSDNNPTYSEPSAQPSRPPVVLTPSAYEESTPWSQQQEQQRLEAAARGSGSDSEAVDGPQVVNVIVTQDGARLGTGAAPGSDMYSQAQSAPGVPQQTQEDNAGPGAAPTGSYPYGQAPNAPGASQQSPRPPRWGPDGNGPQPGMARMPPPTSSAKQIEPYPDAVPRPDHDHYPPRPTPKSETQMVPAINDRRRQSSSEDSEGSENGEMTEAEMRGVAVQAASVAVRATVEELTSILAQLVPGAGPPVPGADPPGMPSAVLPSAGLAAAGSSEDESEVSEGDSEAPSEMSARDILLSLNELLLNVTASRERVARPLRPVADAMEDSDSSQATQRGRSSEESESSATSDRLDADEASDSQNVLTRPSRGPLPLPRQPPGDLEPDALAQPGTSHSEARERDNVPARSDSLPPRLHGNRPSDYPPEMDDPYDRGSSPPYQQPPRAAGPVAQRPQRPESRPVSPSNYPPEMEDPYPRGSSPTYRQTPRATGQEDPQDWYQRPQRPAARPVNPYNPPEDLMYPYARGPSPTYRQPPLDTRPAAQGLSQSEARERELAARSDSLWPQRLANRPVNPSEYLPEDLAGTPHMPTFESMYRECVRRASTLRQRQSCAEFSTPVLLRDELVYESCVVERIENARYRGEPPDWSSINRCIMYFAGNDRESPSAETPQAQSESPSASASDMSKSLSDSAKSESPSASASDRSESLSDSAESESPSAPREQSTPPEPAQSPISATPRSNGPQSLTVQIVSPQAVPQPEQQQISQYRPLRAGQYPVQQPQAVPQPEQQQPSQYGPLTAARYPVQQPQPGTQYRPAPYYPPPSYGQGRPREQPGAQQTARPWPTEQQAGSYQRGYANTAQQGGERSPGRQDYVYPRNTDPQPPPDEPLRQFYNTLDYSVQELYCYDRNIGRGACYGGNSEYYYNQ